MPGIVMFDSIDPSALPGGAAAVAGYVDGAWATYSALRAKFPHADILSIAVSAAHDAECLDIEAGDATPDDAAGWCARQAARGQRRPCLYASISLMASAVLPALQAAGISRSSVRLWSAHYGAGEHICGPSSCGQAGQDMDGTQWTDTVQGVSLDQSLLAPGFFGVPAPAPAAASWANVAIPLPVLSAGASDAALPHQYVRLAQFLVNGFAASSAPLVPDGYYGALTQAAVRAVQKKNHLVTDGITGPATWLVLITGP